MTELELPLLAGAGPNGREATAVMQRQISHLVRLVDDLLEVSRITRGGQLQVSRWISGPSCVRPSTRAVRRWTPRDTN